jgi:hypothetical protein
MQKVDINNPLSYKQTWRKPSNAFICIPPLNTRVTNAWYGTESYTTRSAPFVLAGVLGELYVVPFAYVERRYTHCGQPLTSEFIKLMVERIKMPGGWQTWVMDWLTIQPSQAVCMACHVPVGQIGQIRNTTGFITRYNAFYKAEEKKRGLSHGTGDFLMCDVYPNSSKPNFYTRRVVNGVIFSRGYALDFFKGKTDPEQRAGKPITLEQLPKLYEKALPAAEPDASALIERPEPKKEPATVPAKALSADETFKQICDGIKQKLGRSFICTVPGGLDVPQGVCCIEAWAGGEAALICLWDGFKSYRVKCGEYIELGEVKKGDTQGLVSGIVETIRKFSGL